MANGCPSCEEVYDVCLHLIAELGLASVNHSCLAEEEKEEEEEGGGRTDAAKGMREEEKGYWNPSS